MLKRHYSYTVLRYLHDPSTYEFVNVGVVMLCPATDGQNALLLGRTRTTVGRLREFFPVDRHVFRDTMRTVNRLLQRAAKRVLDEGLFRTSTDALTLAQTVVPADSSSLQWSPLMAGVTSDPEKSFESIFRRMVTKYDTKAPPRRSDEEIWKPVRQELEHRRLLVDLAPKVIVGGDDRIEFQHAWKNGIWHVYEPLSLDLSDADGIYRKVHRWLGQLTSVAPEAAEAFQPHFIVGAPSDPDLQNAYERALRILKKSPGDVEVFEETDVSQLVDRIEHEMKAHSS
ncbi:MAG: hypothetical protein QOK17_2550 [Sphingomonadales bacterium]|jgi:hypothetical protein|nr:hypothetical protein [Sphingomonadales bacterium]